MMSLTVSLYTQVSDSEPCGPLVFVGFFFFFFFFFFFSFLLPAYEETLSPRHYSLAFSYNSCFPSSADIYMMMQLALLQLQGILHLITRWDST